MVPFNILTLFILTLPFLLRWGYDTYWIKKAKTKISKRGYLVRNTLTGGLILIAGVIAKVYINPNPPTWTGILFSFTIFFALFDYLLNLSRGLNFFYVSPDPSHNSYWERLRSNMPTIAEFFLKLWLVSVGAGCYYSYYLL